MAAGFGGGTVGLTGRRTTSGMLRIDCRSTFGIGRFNSEEEIDYVGKHVVEAVTRLREMSPLWEMVQEGIDLKSIQWAQH